MADKLTEAAKGWSLSKKPGKSRKGNGQPQKQPDAGGTTQKKKGRWLVSVEDRQFAASDLEELKRLVKTGELNPGDMIQPPGASGWAYAMEVSELASLFDSVGSLTQTCPGCGASVPQCVGRCSACFHDFTSSQSQSCFPGTTRVLTASGYRRIDQFEAGHRVFSLGPDGGIRTETVTRRLSYEPTEILEFPFEDGSRPLRTTLHHTLLTETGWRRADEINRSDRLQCVTANGTPELRAVETSTLQVAEPVYNLYTTGIHNFIAEGVVAHNFTEMRMLRVLAHRLFVDPCFSSCFSSCVMWVCSAEQSIGKSKPFR